MKLDLTLEERLSTVVATAVPAASLVSFDGEPRTWEETPKPPRPAPEMERYSGEGREELSRTGNVAGSEAVNDTFAEVEL